LIGIKGGCANATPTLQENTQDNPRVSQLKKMKEMEGFSNRGLTKNVF
jgi:hypothetical protein